VGFQNPGSGNGSVLFVPPVGFWNGIAGNTPVDGWSMASPTVCTLSALKVIVNNFTAPGSDTTTITVYQNRAATPMSCSVTTNGNKNSCSDSTHPLPVALGDLLSIGFAETNVNPFNSITVSMTCQ
jgi:hypothetical protein